MAVYIIRAGETGPVKIGFAEMPMRRLSALQSGNHVRLSLIRLLDATDALEADLHQRFRSEWIRGSWFHFVPEMLTADFGCADRPIPMRRGTWSFDQTVQLSNGVMANHRKNAARRALFFGPRTAA